MMVSYEQLWYVALLWDAVVESVFPGFRVHFDSPSSPSRLDGGSDFVLYPASHSRGWINALTKTLKTAPLPVGFFVVYWKIYVMSAHTPKRLLNSELDYTKFSTYFLTFWGRISSFGACRCFATLFAP
mmetsp:Transcript_99905/g.172266  ORF Transcript_99905/g.172266 Transcript_99905/m.172266 type:complete len:128 (+) Transcript_99905:317-700(+)